MALAKALVLWDSHANLVVEVVPGLFDPLTYRKKTLGGPLRASFPCSLLWKIPWDGEDPPRPPAPLAERLYFSSMTPGISVADNWSGPAVPDAGACQTGDNWRLTRYTRRNSTTFASFTTWPEDALPASASFAICVSGDDRVADAVDQFAGRPRADGRRVVVRRVSVDSAGDCHLLYWSSPPTEGQAVVRQLAGRPVLTVSDSLEFTRAGGVMNVFVEEGKMRFAVNPTAAERAKLKISSKLLNLAQIVKDGEPWV